MNIEKSETDDQNHIEMPPELSVEDEEILDSIWDKIDTTAFSAGEVDPNPGADG